MDLKHTTSVAAADSPDTDSETPLHPQHFSSFPIGKNHHHLQPPPTVVAYKQCLKNHAATIGSHALDGCGEFMPSLTCTPHEPSSLKCAACGCHRNFHRREPINDVYAYAPHVFLSLTEADQSPGTPAAVKLESQHGRKRFRTKFSQKQKEKMYLFAEKVGWKMQRCDDNMVTNFCNEIGIKRGVLKVWMHNNKSTFGKKDHKETTSPATTPAAAAGDKSIDVYNNGRVVISGDQSHEEDVDADPRDNSNSNYQENGGSVHHLQAFNNGSSSSC
ncbi:hypothetical protein L1987_61944 [Smallanthus sonchifolius]|uniref:Uncharacterized protein n=1 Tax=Smallanthus sonchifolius TaxID=185202 RepID=A0ACB9C9B8_9ASTR|nr:hypothetical protein L1987_61944 [Smallanthus sonchifolius]